ncbi:HEAT repeat domain-containing protein [Streptomyces sp. AC558_RSS880]|uniref:HEAT repeat domain-containing protein n=1 Tax=Streptomyces sp. AC558_RSS880 TaxID=2823687 RepID=UPI001C2414D5|nr:HEAT repeat domain-containing protein [Streptomyces sp. AC558_RSS880]
MFNGLHDIDWSSMDHAYGSAEEVPALLPAFRSPDAGERSEALSRFYSAVHHQGDVYPCTAASLPFLFELAGDAETPDRAAVVKLLVSIGSIAVERCEEVYGHPSGYADAAAIVRARAEEIVGFASDADPRVRRAAIPGLGLFVDDADRAADVLRGRLPAESWVAQRLLVVEAMATLALRRPEVAGDAMEWLDELAADPVLDPGTRLAAVVHRARCAPERIGEDVVPAALGLLREAARVTVPAETWADPPRRTAPAVPADGVPPQVVAAFEDLDRHGRVHAPTTELLRTLHEVLEGRTPQRTHLLAEQLRTPDPGSRLDALRMSADLMKSWRGDHTALIRLVAEQLGATDPQVAAEAAAVLEACHPIAEPAREELAAHVAAQRAAHGADVWAAPQPQLRRAHQKAVRALARLGDTRALPSLLTALDGGVDGWRAVEVAGALPQAAGQLVPRLCDRLRRVDVTQEWSEMSARALLSALAALGDATTAVPAVTETLEQAVRHERWHLTCSALAALKKFGSAAAPARETVRALTSASDAHVKPAAVAALWAVGGDREEVMPLLHDLLDDSITFRIGDAADMLGEIGPPAAAALPRLRELLAHGYDWVRVHCAAALWDIGGEAEAGTVLDVLLQAWTRNPSTANHVMACLDRMGHAAQPALPLLRAQLALPRRGGRFASIDHDEELQRTGRAVIGRLAGATA